MVQRTFDGLRYARQLKDAGVPEEQAEIMAEALGIFADNLVTKEYLDARLDARFAEQDRQIDARFAEQNRRIDSSFARVDIRINTITVMVAAIFATTVLPEIARLFQ